ncbi:hypothetical protein ACQKEX_15125 [Bacillus pumilus]|uniref:hypothetical protein n=1 Tax=Bacillus TaxID=1386 RepID=UPI0009671C99|nr:hypothetical protein [Bacillus pumilus]MBU8576470.1 hypothetical protein [Bacillus pumilus]OLP64330.1 hypothetical protein BACPU_25550 [Bacillus pumilus]
MKILEKGLTYDGTNLQVEDWSEDYSFHSYGDTLGVYPRAKVSLSGEFSPKEGRTFRLALDFNDNVEAVKAFHSLRDGKTKLIDYVENIRDKKLIACI